ncbi:UNVERIFIED_CONTAM: hypothetical protein PYX00_000380 [Menopon gallinae]|uniref:Uncharacterized protein n=1 Tax=Menopon gallinae TaxID=328185 RepID=A0AAW2I8A2_9NEOP
MAEVAQEPPSVTPQGKVNFCMKVINCLMCHPNNPEFPKTKFSKKIVNCLKPVQDESGPGDQPKREAWENRCQFFMSTLGMAVGLGSIWRFPVLAYKMGGATFVIIYMAVIMLLGNALFFYEVSSGQYTSKGPLRVYDKVPPFKGIGMAMIVYSYFFCTYYIHMVSFALYYFFACFTNPLPWTYCPDETKERPDPVTCTPFSENLKSGFRGVICGNTSLEVDEDLFCSNDQYMRSQMEKCCNAIPGINETECPIYMNATNICSTKEYPSAYYWSHSVIKEYRMSEEHYGYLGEVNGGLVLTSFLAWAICYIGLYKGLRSLGIMMYILVPLPYVILVTMFVVAVIQEGAIDGLKKLFIPDFYSFINIDVWRTATEQAFYSVGVAMGPLITFGSYQRFNSPSHIDGTLVCVSIVLTGILCCLVVFSVLGFLSAKTGRGFEDVVSAGPGLVFIVYPESLELLPASAFFAALFYLMLINLGISSVTGIIESVSSAVYDIWPKTRRYKYVVNLLVILSSFFIGISITARGGLLVYEAFDTYAAGMTLIPLCTLELLTGFVYGIGRLCEDISFMIGFYPNRYYRYIWMLGPIVLTGIFVYGLVKFELKEHWKIWTHLLSWFLFWMIVSNILVTFIVVVIKYAVKKDIKNVFKPPPDHGPEDLEKRAERETYSVKRKIF